MKIFLLNLLLSLAWASLTGEFSPANLTIGFGLGYAALWITLRQKREVTGYFFKVYRICSFGLFFLWELNKANLRVAYDVLTPRHRMSPGIIAVPLDARTDAEITFFANLITLTPGTLSLDVSTDRRVLYVHAMYVEDADLFRKEIKQGLERRLLEVLR